MLYDIQNLHFSYRAKGPEVLKGVNLSIRQGEILTVLGRNGAGKSTLFSCMLGMKKPQQGSIRIQGRSIGTMTEREMRKLSRADLLEILLEQSRELDQLRAELDEANRKLAQREIAIDRAGTLAEAALLLNGVFEAADKACRQYEENFRARLAQETCLKCEQLPDEAEV